MLNAKNLSFVKLACLYIYIYIFLFINLLMNFIVLAIKKKNGKEKKENGKIKNNTNISIQSINFV